MTDALIHRYDRIPGTGFQHQREVERYLNENTDWVIDWDRVNKDADAKVGAMKDDIEREFKYILGIAEISPGNFHSQPGALDLLNTLRSDVRNALRRKRGSGRPRVK